MQLLKLTILPFMLFFLNVKGQEMDSTHAYIFWADQKVVLIKIAPGSTRFRPSIREVLKADSLLLIYLRNSKDFEGKNDTYHSYFRQYVGLISPGLKGIYVNAFCRKPDYFEKETFYPRGGGKCYFRALINLQTSRIEDFSFNAPK
jgi:hypothetical protein